MDPTPRDPADEAERARLLGRLAAGIAHDLNNLFTAAYAALDGLEREAAPTQGDALWQLRRCVDRGAGLGRWLVAFGRRRGGPPDVVDPAVLLRSVERLLARALPEGLSLTLSLRRDAGLVLADEGLVERLVAALLLAGVDAAPAAGELTLACEPAAERRLALSVTSAGRAPAVDADLAALVAGLGGRLELQAERLSVLLPTVDEHDDEPAAPTAVARPVRVLLCEGDELVREALGAQLRSHGHAVEVAAGASAALAEDAREGPPPELLVTELCLPDGDGPSLARSLRAAHPDLALLFVASPLEAAGALADDPLVQGALLIKPFRNEVLGEALARALG